MRQLSNNLVVIPNGQLAKTNMINYTRPEQQLTVLVQVGVGYDSDLEHVEKVTTEVVAEVMAEITGAVPDHEPAVRFHTFGDSRIGFTVILGVGEFSDQYRIKHEFIKRLHQRYRTEGIRIPAPTRTVALQQGSAVIPHPRSGDDMVVHQGGIDPCDGVRAPGPGAGPPGRAGDRRGGWRLVRGPVRRPRGRVGGRGAQTGLRPAGPAPRTGDSGADPCRAGRAHEIS